jgi:hypothetical protein
MLFNALLITVLLMSQNARFGAVDKRFDDLLRYMDQRFTSVDQRFTAMETRFDDLKELWRAELHRVEEVLDARLKHLERD